MAGAFPIEAELLHKLEHLPNADRVLADFERRLRERELFFGKGLLPTFLRPHLVQSAQFDLWIDETERMFALMERAVTYALEHVELFEWLGFTPEAVELFRIDPGYSRNVAVGRPDAVDVNGHACFLEINADSPAMMTMSDEIQSILLDIAPVSDFREHLRPDIRVTALLDALLACYREYGGTSTSPTIAIVDWAGEKTAHEQKKTAERFTALGAPSFVATPEELTYDGGRLSAHQRPIDIVYRRVLCRDFVTRRAQLDPLLSAYRDGRVCMVNPLRSYIVGTKSFMALLHHEEGVLPVSAEERALIRRVIPETRYVSPGERVEQRGWVLKKTQSHGGVDVVVGDRVDADTWRSVLAGVKERSWIRQALQPVPTYAVPVLKGDRLVFEPRYMNWNPFVFGGRHGGSFARVSDSVIINITAGGGLLPTIRVA